MSQKISVNVPLNRVEGDLEVEVEIDDGVVSNVKSSGTMYRGFEKILVGREARDGLVITPRICGICSTSHLVAAVKALENVVKVTPPPNAARIRNLALMVEQVQSDVRHAFLMFTPDFVNPAYQNQPLFEEAARRYEPFKGETVIEVFKETKRILEIIAIIGGQWPHSSFMVPGGVVSVPTAGDIMQCQHLLKQYRKWYEERILGCNLERWQEIRSNADLEWWLGESDKHRESDLGFYIRFARDIGLDKIGQGYGNFISFPSLELPEDTQVEGAGKQPYLISAGFARGTKVQDRFNQENITEHVAYSWFKDYQGGKHPFVGETNPKATGQEGKKYSWAKAPRYDNIPAETGPLAEMITARNPLFIDLLSQNGHRPNVFIRELARLTRAVSLIPAMEIWLAETLAMINGVFYKTPRAIIKGQGIGLTNAARGALGHWIKVDKRTIQHYQIITPTAWNASPRDYDGVKGPWEEALMGTRVEDIDNPVALGHVVRSFDACLVCTVHTVARGKKK